MVSLSTAVGIAAAVSLVCLGLGASFGWWLRGLAPITCSGCGLEFSDVCSVCAGTVDETPRPSWAMNTGTQPQMTPSGP